MVYSIEIPITLPTYADEARALEQSRDTARILSGRVVSCLAKWLSKAPNFGARAYVGVVWVRPTADESLRSVGFAKSLILRALRCAGVISSTLTCPTYVFDLAHRVNPRRPRTIIYIASSKDELFEAWEATYAQG